jgi:hypothetical protein
MHCIGKLISKEDWHRHYNQNEEFVKIPISFDDQVPEIPEVLHYDDKYYVLVTTNPLMYRECSCSEITRRA